LRIWDSEFRVSNLNLVCRKSGKREGWHRIEVEAFLALNLLGRTGHQLAGYGGSWQDELAVCRRRAVVCRKKKAVGRTGRQLAGQDISWHDRAAVGMIGQQLARKGRHLARIGRQMTRIGRQLAG